MMRTLIVVFCLSLISFTAIAQNETYRNTLTGNIGFSITGASIDLFDGKNLLDFDLEIDDYGSVSGDFVGRSLPAFQVNYDYGITKWFSVGGGISYQNLNFTISDLSYTSPNGTVESVDRVRFSTNRINVAGRVLFHYGNAGDIDMYSGFRFGVTNWLTDFSATDAAIERDIENGIPFFGVVPAAQLIPFGLRGYFGENWGANFELGIGSPHFLSLGASYRL